MNDWQSTWLGRRSLPRDLGGFEIEAFFNFSDAERRVIEGATWPSAQDRPGAADRFLAYDGTLA